MTTGTMASSQSHAHQSCHQRIEASSLGRAAILAGGVFARAIRCLLINSGASQFWRISKPAPSQQPTADTQNASGVKVQQDIASITAPLLRAPPLVAIISAMLPQRRQFSRRPFLNF